MCHDNDAKFEEELTCRFKPEMRNLTKFDPSTQKSQKQKFPEIDDVIFSAHENEANKRNDLRFNSRNKKSSTLFGTCTSIKSILSKKLNSNQNNF